MTEENTQVEAPEVQTPTIEELYKEAGIDAAPQQTQVQPQETKKEQIDVPDPFDIDAHKRFQADLAEQVRTLKQSQESLSSTLQTERQKVAMAALEADIKQASEFVAKEAGIDLYEDSQANVDLATFELNRIAMSDPKFKAIWDSRNSTPQAKAAYNRALEVVSKKISEKYSARKDPQLVAQKKALAAARQSSATTSQEDSSEPSWGSAQGREFEANWNLLIGRQG